MRISKVILASCLVSAAGAAQAELRICNDSDREQSIAIGYNGDEGWTSEGWWNIAPGACETPIEGDLDKRYIYLRAEHKAGPFKGEGYSFCTTGEVFTIVGDEDCDGRGYDTEDFLEIDTGETATSYTYRLTAEAMEVAQDTEDAEGLHFCNQTAHTQAISVGYLRPTDEVFVSEGWWNVDPGACLTPLSGALKTRYYYYRAEVDAGDFNGDGYSFCTSPEAYTIEGDSDCEARGHISEDFAEIDTGPTSTTYTFELTDQTGGLVDGAAAAPAGLRFCNDTEVEQSVSVGYEGDGGWTSEGWWNVEPGSCTSVLSDALEKQYYYYRAEVDAGEFNGGGYTFCTSPEAYTIVGDADCEARGYDKEDFAEIALAAGTQGHTVRLTTETGGVFTPATAASTDVIDSAGASIEVCNNTDFGQDLAFGYEGAEGWTSEGWWYAEPGECVEPALDGVRHQYLYYRAEVDGGGFDGQSYFFCTTSEAFTIVGDENCEARGYAREDFREINLGDAEGMFTLTLVDGMGGNTDAGLAPAPEGSTAPAGTSGAPLGDRLGGSTTPAPEPEPAPEPKPEPEPVPEPEPAPEIVPDPEPDPEAPANPRRTGSRG